MKIAISGKIIDIPSGGPSGPDGNPIGTVISYMGTTAPKDYLICDGTTYNISDYYKLAQFFKTQFGAENYFGGDGTTTFAVPDMRNLFLRGFHGEATEQLSGDLGVKQEATRHVNLGGEQSIWLAGAEGRPASNVDSSINAQTDRFTALTKASGGPPNVGSYTSRPVNMAVLYCIKATVAESYENVYSTEETRIGTWINGKPLYQKVYTGSFRITTSETLIVLESSFRSSKELRFAYGWARNYFRYDYVYEYAIPSAFVPGSFKDYYGLCVDRDGSLKLSAQWDNSADSTYELIVHYTKTTDQGATP